MADALPSFWRSMQPADFWQAPLLPDNDQQAAILLPDDTAIYGDPR